MRMFLIKLLLRLLNDNSYKQMEDRVIQEWIMGLGSETSGYRGYYTIRKREILKVMGIGLEQKEYWMMQGRLAELKHLNQLSTDLIKKYEAEKKSKENGKKTNDA